MRFLQAAVRRSHRPYSAVSAVWASTPHYGVRDVTARQSVETLYQPSILPSQRHMLPQLHLAPILIHPASKRYMSTTGHGTATTKPTTIPIKEEPQKVPASTAAAAAAASSLNDVKTKLSSSTAGAQTAVGKVKAKAIAVKDRVTKIIKFMGKLATMSKKSIILLGKEFRVATKIVWKVGVHGHRYSHAEKLRLRRAAKDVITIIPIAGMLAVLGSEITLLLAVRAIPGFLPKAFDKVAVTVDENVPKVLDNVLKPASVQQQMRVDKKKHLAEAIAMKNKAFSKEFAATGNEDYEFAHQDSATVSAFFERHDDPHTTITPAEVIEVGPAFQRRMRLDQLSRSQVMLMAQYLGVGLGPANLVMPTFVLRRLLRGNIRMLRQDDKDIHFEGVDNLSAEDLKHSCTIRGLSRGGNTTDDGKPSDFLRTRLRYWLLLSVHRDVPSSLLILMSAFLTRRHTILSDEIGSVGVKQRMMELRLSTLHDKRDSYNLKIAALEAKINKYETDQVARTELAAEDEVIAKIMEFGEDDVEELTAFKEIFEAYADTYPANDAAADNDGFIQAPTEASDAYLSQKEIANRFAEKQAQKDNKKQKVKLELSPEAGAKAMAKVLKILRDEDGELASADSAGDSKKDILAEKGSVVEADDDAALHACLEAGGEDGAVELDEVNALTSQFVLSRDLDGSGTISWSEFMIAISELRRRQETDVNAGRSVTLKDREAALDELEKMEEELSEKYEGVEDANVQAEDELRVFEGKREGVQEVSSEVAGSMNNDSKVAAKNK